MNYYVAYYRVSTPKQGRSGLGLEAQQAAVKGYIGTAPDSKLMYEFTDVETGSHNKRPQLAKALEVAKKLKATLVIAKLDRLSRNITFITSLQDSKVNFVCCDMPDANEFTIHIFAAIAQWERKTISQRTKDALAQAKNKGIKLGITATMPGKNRSTPNFTNETRALGRIARKQAAIDNPSYKRAKAYATLLREQGNTLLHIAKELNYCGFTAAYGGNFGSETVRRILNEHNKITEVIK